MYPINPLSFDMESARFPIPRELRFVRDPMAEGRTVSMMPLTISVVVLSLESDTSANWFIFPISIFAVVVASPNPSPD